MSASSPGTGNLDLEKRIEKVDERVSTNSFGGVVTLTSGVEYTCPCDGYFHLSADHTPNSAATGVINGVVMAVVSTSVSVESFGSRYTSIFVKRGMKIKAIIEPTVNKGSAKFYPLV